jgi:hypothetical protein
MIARGSWLVDFAERTFEGNGIGGGETRHWEAVQASGGSCMSASTGTCVTPSLRHLAGLGMLLTITLVAAQASAQTLSPNSDATATLAAGVRYRNFNNGGGTDVYVFPSPCCATTTNGNGAWSGSDPVSITYDGTTLSTTAAGVTTARNVGNLGSLNYLQIQITKNGAANTVAFNSIALNGGSSLGNAAITGGANTLLWKITGADLSAGFTLTGTKATTGGQPGGDGNFIQVEVGYVAPADNQGPVTSSVATAPIPALLAGSVTVTANVSDVTTGNNNVASADYDVNGGGWTALTPSDGAFDSPNEDVEGSFTATQLGVNEVCVKGTDALANVGTAACQTFLVTYKFDGFFSPIDNDPVNLVKAGQAIPAKWRLTDANDVPIDDPASFVNLLSYPIDCSDLSGDPLDSVEEVAAGASGLQYAGDGYWQFNWKTPKNYADTCRAMYVEFNSGALSPVIKFKFRR